MNYREVADIIERFLNGTGGLRSGRLHYGDEVRVVKYLLDAADRVQTVQNGPVAGTNYASLNYTTTPGNTLTISLGNGVTEKPSLNDRFQPTGLQVTSATAGSLLTLGLFPCPLD